MKNNALIRIVLYSLLILMLVGILVGTLLPSGRKTVLDIRDPSHEETYIPKRTEEVAPEDSAPLPTDAQPEPTEEASEATEDIPGPSVPLEGTMDFPSDQVKALDIEWAAGKVIICAGEVLDVAVTEDGPQGAEQARIRLTDKGTLKISYGHDMNWIFGLSSPDEKDLLITVPLDLELQEIDLDFASADVEILDLAGTLREIEIDGASGTCLIENCKVKELDVDTASGDVTFSGSLDKLDFDAASASFEGVFDNNPKSLNMDSMSGDLEITIPKDCGFTVKLDALSGRFRSDISTRKADGSQVHGDGACKINVNGMSGDVEIHTK